MATHKEKEQEKLKLLYDIYEQPMYRIAYAILHHTEQAEDAVSDAFLRILKNLKKIGDVRSEKAKHYIISIIRSTAINEYRQNQRDSERYTVWDDRILQVPNQKDDMEQEIAEHKARIKAEQDALEAAEQALANEQKRIKYFADDEKIDMLIPREKVECAEEGTQFGISSHYLALKVDLTFLRLVLATCVC